MYLCSSDIIKAVITPDRKAFLQRRLRNAAKDQPDLKLLKSLLLKIGGEYLVAPPKFDPDIPMLLRNGFVMSGEIKAKIMRTSMCHQNVAAAWRNHKTGVVAIATGYALSDDGLWRQHSWGILRYGILETTEVRIRYFGILLQDARADEFAEANKA